MFLEGPENTLIAKFVRNVLVMEVLANLRSSLVAPSGLMIKNIVRELGPLLSVGIRGFRHSRGLVEIFKEGSMLMATTQGASKGKTYEHLRRAWPDINYKNY